MMKRYSIAALLSLSFFGIGWQGVAMAQTASPQQYHADHSTVLPNGGNTSDVSTFLDVTLPPDSSTSHTDAICPSPLRHVPSFSDSNTSFVLNGFRINGGPLIPATTFAGTVHSLKYRPPAPGTYSWTAEYTETDSNSTTFCTPPNRNTTVSSTVATPPMTFVQSAAASEMSVAPILFSFNSSAATTGTGLIMNTGASGGFTANCFTNDLWVVIDTCSGGPYNAGDPSSIQPFTVHINTANAAIRAAGTYTSFVTVTGVSLAMNSSPFAKTAHAAGAVSGSPFVVGIVYTVASPDFGVTVTPDSRTVFQGQVANYTLNLSSLNGFTGLTDLTITGLPPGVSFSLGGSAATSTNPSPTPPPVDSGIVTPPGVTVLSDLQNSPWLTCGACGNTGGTGLLATYQMTPGIASPSLSGHAAEFAINANGQPYANAYWYKKISGSAAPQTPLSYFEASYDIYVPSASVPAIQGIELDGQQGIGGNKTYNFGWQALYAGNEWRMFDFVNKKWDASPVPFTRFTPDTWHHIVAVYHIDPATGLAPRDAYSVDGNVTNLNIPYPPLIGVTNTYLSYGFQLDSNNQGLPYKVYVDNYTVKYK